MPIDLSASELGLRGTKTRSLTEQEQSVGRIVGPLVLLQLLLDLLVRQSTVPFFHAVLVRFPVEAAHDRSTTTTRDKRDRTPPLFFPRVTTTDPFTYLAPGPSYRGGPASLSSLPRGRCPTEGGIRGRLGCSVESRATSMGLGSVQGERRIGKVWRNFLFPSRRGRRRWKGTKGRGRRGQVVVVIVLRLRSGIPGSGGALYSANI